MVAFCAGLFSSIFSIIAKFSHYVPLCTVIIPSPLMVLLALNQFYVVSTHR